MGRFLKIAKRETTKTPLSDTIFTYNIHTIDVLKTFTNINTKGQQVWCLGVERLLTLNRETM